MTFQQSIKFLKAFKITSKLLPYYSSTLLEKVRKRARMRCTSSVVLVHSVHAPDTTQRLCHFSRITTRQSLQLHDSRIYYWSLSLSLCLVCVGRPLFLFMASNIYLLFVCLFNLEYRICMLHVLHLNLIPLYTHQEYIVFCLFFVVVEHFIQFCL